MVKCQNVKLQEQPGHQKKMFACTILQLNVALDVSEPLTFNIQRQHFILETELTGDPDGETVRW